MLLELLQYPIIQNAYLAGGIVALVAAFVGYFITVRSLTFASHALAHIGFAGAAGAVLLSLDPVVGLLTFTVGAGIGIGLLGKEMRERDIAIGVIMTLGLGLGILFLTLYHGYAEQAYSILFGTILGISQQDVLITAICGTLTMLTLSAIFRPLLFSSLDQEVAQARAVPVRMLSILFLMLVAVVVSISVQVVGVLLIFTLLIGPAATAMRLTHQPLWTITLAMALGLAYTWTGISIAIYTNWPVSFCIATLSFGIYLPVRLLSPLWPKRYNRKNQDKPELSPPQPLPMHNRLVTAGSQEA